MQIHDALQLPLKQISCASSTIFYDESTLVPSPQHTPLTELIITDASDKTASFKSDTEFDDPPAAPTTTTQSNSTGTGSAFMESPTDNLVYLSLLNNINEPILINILQREHIIFDSLMRVYSRYLKDYIDIAGVLTKRCLYLTSAVKYQIWQEFRKRSKIDDIINAQHKNESIKIDQNIALELIHNLDLIDDDTMIKAQMMPFLIGKSKLELKLSIILHRNNMTSIAHLFGIDNNEKIVMNDVRYVWIKGTHRRNALIDYILMDIPWIDVVQLDSNSMVFTLQKYFPNYLIEILNDKQTEYFVEHKDSSCDAVQIKRYDGFNINYVQFMKSELKFIDFDVFNGVFSDEMNSNIGYGFVMKKNGKSMILFSVASNNMCSEWMTHIDYAMNGQIDTKDTKYDNKMKDTARSRLTNDFAASDTMNRCCSFGQNLNYWQTHCDNYVDPRYKTLRDELLNNKIHKLASAEYYLLYEESFFLQQQQGFRHCACDANSKNKIYGVAKGTEITINHIISLKLYTDYGAIGEDFAAHCHKLHYNETLGEVVLRNRNIANWCRYLRESVMFYGTRRKKPRYLYTHVRSLIMFDSMWLRVECPLSTTSDSVLCQELCHSSAEGIVLQFKGNMSDTRYLDCWWLNNDSGERLIMGSMLKITGIWMDNSWHKKYVAALLMFEQILNGHFVVNWKIETEGYLYRLMAYYMGYHEDEELDTPPHKYFVQLFCRKQNWMKRLWINHKQLHGIKHEKLRCLLCGCGEFFDRCGVLNARSVQQFEWHIKDESYAELCALAPRQCIKSPPFEYILNDAGDTVQFYLKCYKKHSDEHPSKCAIFLHLNGDELPHHIDAVRVEYDMICDYGKIYKYQRLMPPQWLNREPQHSECGDETLPTKILKTATSLTWTIGMKVLNILHKNSNQMSIETLALALQNSDEERVLKMFNQLIEERKSKEKQLERMKGGIYDLKQKSDELSRSLLRENYNTEVLSKRFEELMALSTRLYDEDTTPTLTIARSYSKEINETEAAAVAMHYEEEEKANVVFDTSRSVTFRSDKTSPQARYWRPHIRADIVNNIYARYNHNHSHNYHQYVMASRSNQTSNTSLANNAGSVQDDDGGNDTYLMPSPTKYARSRKHYGSIDTDYSETQTHKTAKSETVTMSSWDKVTFGDEVSQRRNIYNMFANDSIWDLSNRESNSASGSGYTESTLQQTPQPRSKQASSVSATSSSLDPSLDMNNKSLPAGWSTTYTSSGMLVYLDHVNEIATFQHPLNNAWCGSLRSVAATLDSDDQKGSI